MLITGSLAGDICDIPPPPPPPSDALDELLLAVIDAAATVATAEKEFLIDCMILDKFATSCPSGDSMFPHVKIRPWLSTNEEYEFPAPTATT
jgi:hypothetical protein